jgi:hypothetical protein
MKVKKAEFIKEIISPDAVLSFDSYTTFINIPQQFPKGVDAEVIEIQAKL